MFFSLLKINSLSLFFFCFNNQSIDWSTEQSINHKFVCSLCFNSLIFFQFVLKTFVKSNQNKKTRLKFTEKRNKYGKFYDIKLTNRFKDCFFYQLKMCVCFFFWKFMKNRFYFCVHFFIIFFFVSDKLRIKIGNTESYAHNFEYNKKNHAHKHTDRQTDTFTHAHAHIVIFFTFILVKRIWFRITGIICGSSCQSRNRRSFSISWVLVLLQFK